MTFARIKTIVNQAFSETCQVFTSNNRSSPVPHCRGGSGVPGRGTSDRLVRLSPIVPQAFPPNSLERYMLQ